MPSLRDIRRRIRSTQNMQKITKAMQVVSATRLRRAQAAVQATRPYAEKMVEVLATTAERATEYRHSYLERREGDRALLIVVTADRGLAGALNTNTLRSVNRYVNQHHRGQARYVTIGRKGRDFLDRYRRDMEADGRGIKDRRGGGALWPALSAALEEYDEGRADTLLLAYARWVSTLRQDPVVQTLLPISVPEVQAGRTVADYIYEPDPEAVFGALLPRAIETLLFPGVVSGPTRHHYSRL